MDQLGGLYVEAFLDMLSFLNKTIGYLKENQSVLTLFMKPNGPTTNQVKAFMRKNHERMAA
ncbi:hypothetical protein WAX46_04450 [Bacillus sp. FJAT-53060]